MRFQNCTKGSKRIYRWCPWLHVYIVQWEAFNLRIPHENSLPQGLRFVSRYTCCISFLWSALARRFACDEGGARLNTGLCNFDHKRFFRVQSQKVKYWRWKVPDFKTTVHHCSVSLLGAVCSDRIVWWKLQLPHSGRQVRCWSVRTRRARDRHIHVCGKTIGFCILKCAGWSMLTFVCRVLGSVCAST